MSSRNARSGPNINLLSSYGPARMTEARLEKSPLGWESSAVLKPPPCKDSAKVRDRSVGVILNHLPATINSEHQMYYPKDSIVKVIQAFDVDIEIYKAEDLSNKMKGVDLSGNGEKNLPKPALRKKILHHAIKEVEKKEAEAYKAKNYPNPTKLATDGSKSAYTVHPIRHVITGDPVITGDMKSVRDQLDQLEISDSEGSGDKFSAPFKPVAKIPWDENCKEFFRDMKKHVDSGKEIPTQFTDLTRVYSTALRTEPMKALTQVGSSNFYPTPVPGDDGFPLGGGLSCYDGFSLTCTMGWSPYVTLDSAYAVFRSSGPVLNVLRNFFGGDSTNILDGSWNENEFIKAEAFLKGCKVAHKAAHGKMKGKLIYSRVTGLSRKVASDIKFDITNEAGRLVATSVAEHFAKGGMRQKFPNGPCLQFQKGNSSVPAEFCTIEKDQPWTRGLTKDQTTNMIKETAKPPTERFNSIKESIKSLDTENNQVLKEFRFKPEANLLRIPSARVISMPNLVYGTDKVGSNCEISPSQDRGVWNIFNNKGFNLGFYRPFRDEKTVSWNVVNLKSPGRPHRLVKHIVEDFLEELVAKAMPVGLNLTPVKKSMGKRGGYTELAPTARELEEYFRGVDKNTVKFVFIILEDDSNDVYSRVKKTAEITANGVLTQCIKAVNVSDRKGRGSKIENILNKLNMKLGGVNYLIKGDHKYEAINWLNAPVMMMGADVSHPDAGSKTPSMAAVTASVDKTVMQYMVYIQAQEVASRGAAEVITGLDKIVVMFLKKYTETNKTAPRKIIMYRDGVGDSQFEEVLRTEMMGIRDGCTAFWKEITSNLTESERSKIIYGVGPGVAYEPKITFINVQKRHKTRIFAEIANSDKKGNPPPGTVIDTHIVNPALTDFYLLSHDAIQGTPRAAHYQVIWDDSKFTMDEILKMSYNLCFCFTRCTRSVGYPAPAYYAHLGASRGQNYIKELNVRDFENIYELNQKIQRQTSLVENFPMHFI